MCDSKRMGLLDIDLVGSQARRADALRAGPNLSEWVAGAGRALPLARPMAAPACSAILSGFTRCLSIRIY
jgi:hypothetical protein